LRIALPLENYEAEVDAMDSTLDSTTTKIAGRHNMKEWWTTPSRLEKYWILEWVLRLVLGMYVASASLECDFGQAGNILTRLRNSMTASIFEMMLFLKILYLDESNWPVLKNVPNQSFPVSSLSARWSMRKIVEIAIGLGDYDADPLAEGVYAEHLLGPGNVDVYEVDEADDL
jgi:hAT family C-terminal dimerisation region